MLQSYPVISTSLISTSRYLDINLRSRQKQSLFNIKLPGYLDISISTSRYLDIISNPLEWKLDIWHCKTCKIRKNWKKNTKFILFRLHTLAFCFLTELVNIFAYFSYQFFGYDKLVFVSLNPFLNNFFPLCLRKVSN